MSGQTISNSETRIEALKLQSSAYGVTIPLVFGLTRISGNLVWYGGFKGTPHTDTQGGKGGGVKTQNTSYTYSASVIMGLCHGPITGIPRIWRGKKLYSGGVTPSQVLTVTENFTAPGPYTLAHAAAFAAVVEVRVSAGSGSDVWNRILELDDQYSIAAGVVTVSDASLAGASVSITYQYTSGSISTTALTGLGLTFKRGDLAQPAWSALSAYPAENIAYSGLAYVAGQDYDLGTGAQVENHIFEVVGPMAYHLGSSQPDVDPSIMLRQVLTQAQGGAGFPGAQLDAWASWSDYCVAAGLLVSPAITEQVAAAEVVRTAALLTNTGPVWSAGRLKMLPYADSAESGNGRTFTPSTTPIYDLDDECYTPASSDDAPILVHLKSSAERFNHQRVEYFNRDKEYNVEIAEAKDQADIEANGLRSAEIVSAHWICHTDVARRVAQNLLQRSLYVCAEYVVPLPWHYALIEPMDLLTLTDSVLGMNTVPVRVTMVEEAEDGDLKVTCEDYPAGTASAALYPSQGGSGYSHDYNAQPLSVQAPMFFEAPVPQAGETGLAVCIAVTGQAGDVAWGGATLWVSSDGTNYRQLGRVVGGARYGTLRAAITSGASTVPVQLVGLGGQMITGSAADANNAATLCYVVNAGSGEFFSHSTASLVAANQYDLTVVRGQFSTPPAAAASGAKWARLDDRVFISEAIDPALIGTTFYVKCTSFNVFGGAEQTLADATPYTYTILGNILALAPVGGGTLQLTATGFAFVFDGAAATSSTSPTITFTAVLQGISGTATFTATAYDASNTSLGTITLGGSGNTRTLTAAQFNSLGATTTRYVKVSASLGGLTDYMTVYRGDNGSDGLAARLTNEAHTVPADNAGTVSSYAGAGGTMEVYKGVALLSNATTPSVSFSLAGYTGFSTTYPAAQAGISIGSTNGVYAVTAGLTSDSGTVTIRATLSTGQTLDAIFSISKSKAGVAGPSSVIYEAEGAVGAIKHAKDGSYNPSTMVWSFYSTTGSAARVAASLYYKVYRGTLSGGTITWSSYITSGPASSYSFTGSMVGYAALKIEVYTDSGYTQQVDVVTTPILDDGSDNVTGYLTNESVTLPADASGTLTGSITTLSAGTFKVFQGTTDVTSSASFGTPTVSNCTASITSGTGAYQATSISADSATATFTATYAGVTISKVLSLAKARAGATGSTGSTGSNGASATYAYQIVTGSTLPSAPAVPSGAPTAGNASTPGVWYSLPPSGSLSTNQWLFQASGTVTGSTYTWVSPSYLATFRVGNLAALSAVVDGAQSTTLPDPASLSGTSMTVALAANTSLGAAVGILGQSSSSGRPGVYGYNLSGYGVFAYGSTGILGKTTGSGNAVQGEATSTSGSKGVVGYSGGANTYGVYGSTPFAGGGYGVWADASSGGTAFYANGPTVLHGTVQIDQTATTGAATATFPGNNKPGSSTTCTWVPVNINGTAGHIPFWPA